MKTGQRTIDKKAAEVLHAYRSWRSPKTATKRQEDYRRRRAVQAANIKSKAELAELLRR